MKKWKKVIIVNLVLFTILALIVINFYKSVNEKLNEANEVIIEIENDEQIRDELMIDSKQVYETLELAHSEQRELSLEEKRLVNEFDAKYNRESAELTFNEKMVVNNLLLMSHEVVPTSRLESEQNRYEDYKNDLLEYVEFE